MAAYDESTEGPPAKKRAVSRRTVEKWIVENDRELNTTVWLKFKTDPCGDHVLSLRYAVCSQFNDRLTSRYRCATTGLPLLTEQQTSGLLPSRTTHQRTCTRALWHCTGSNT